MNANAEGRMELRIGEAGDSGNVAQVLEEVADGRARPADSHAPGPALQECLTANYNRLHHRLLRHLGCPDQASDCLHDAWLKLGGMTVSEVIASPEAYVYRVACNIAIDHLRSDRSWRMAADAEVEWEAIADRVPGPDAVAEARSEVAAVDQALQRLPRHHKSVFAALKLEENTRDKVAADYGISLRTVDTLLRQALDYCAEQTGRPLSNGERPPRRRIPAARLGV